MSSDPRVPVQQKPRQPKSYTEPQIEFLKSHLPEFERRSHGTVRGDAKKYALDRASEFIQTFGLPQEFHTLEEGDSRFKEQIYNWFKNTVGRNRRKLEGKPRSVKKSSVEKAGDNSAISTAISWNGAAVAQPQQTSLATYSHSQHVDSTQGAGPSSPAMNPQPIISQMQYGTMHPNASIPSHSNTPPAPTHAHVPPPPQQQPQPIAVSINMAITQETLCDGFLSPSVDCATLSNMIQSFVASNPGPTPLVPVLDALFAASVAEAPAYSRDPLPLVQKFYETSRYFQHSIVHAGLSGPQAASRAILMQIRKNSVWVSVAPWASNSNAGAGGYRQSPVTSPTTSLSEDMQRMAVERQRRKDHIQWARIHAAALETGMIGFIGRDAENLPYPYTTARAFSEMIARDAVWENDEAEWVAGSFVLRAVIRTALRGDRRQRDEYAEMLRAYEGRWKEIKDEVRQTMATEVLVSAKEELDRLEKTLTA
ncbi:hypothetical protein FA15DRAFT_671508 [Coprinopsis marcescibilis]|uniref:Uncharacterized protein n=1 Tax=Coprinopsis marcescibilis TaxID=230819 RepID=A0A5C3KQQ3_COPMA|nr:hypothetical protein FA15DRAFT_671508 [Coprinopsis marcescibilis]